MSCSPVQTAGRGNSGVVHQGGSGPATGPALAAAAARALPAGRRPVSAVPSAGAGRRCQLSVAHGVTALGDGGEWSGRHAQSDLAQLPFAFTVLIQAERPIEAHAVNPALAALTATVVHAQAHPGAGPFILVGLTEMVRGSLESGDDPGWAAGSTSAAAAGSGGLRRACRSVSRRVADDWRDNDPARRRGQVPAGNW
jgi:hypothetical protein